MVTVKPSPLALALSFALIGCASSGTHARDDRAAGVWQVRLPAGQSPYAPAFGSGERRADIDRTRLAPDIEGFLKPQHARLSKRSGTPAAPVRRQERAPQPGLPVLPVAAPAAGLPQQSQTAPVELAGNREPRSQSSDIERYAQRELQSKRAQEFRGGDVIVISATTIIIILLVVVLILLLT